MGGAACDRRADHGLLDDVEGIGLAGGPLGKLRDGDPIRLYIDTRKLVGTADYMGDQEEFLSREIHPNLAPDPRLPDDTRLWAALQNASGGSWGGSVYDVDEIIRRLSD